jgi:hypothetical protein
VSPLILLWSYSGSLSISSIIFRPDYNDLLLLPLINPITVARYKRKLKEQKAGVELRSRNEVIYTK